MTRLFILIKRKGSKRALGTIPTEKGATVKSLKSLISRKLKGGFSARIITEKQLKQLIVRQAPRQVPKKRKTRVKRTKARRKR